MQDLTILEFIALALIIGGLYLSVCWILLEFFYFNDDEQD